MNSEQKIDFIKSQVRDVQDFPKAGILFKDITTAIKNPQAFKYTIEWFCNQLEGKNIDYVIGLEARGFIFASAVAYNLGIGFIPIRKKGKLPAKTIKTEYELEYGTDIIEIHQDALKKGDKVAIIDDVLATGGTIAASYDLVKNTGADISEILFMLELPALKGKAKLPKTTKIKSMISYD